MKVEAVREILRTERQRVGLATLADRACVSQQLMHNVIAGRRKPRGRILTMLGMELVEDYQMKTD